MNLLEQPQALREAVAVFEAFRRLGFPSSAIYLVPSHGSVAIRVVWEGNDFTVTCGPAPGTAEEIAAQWTEIASAIPTVPESHLDHVYVNSLVRRQSVDMLVALQAKGLHPPVCRNEDRAQMQRLCQKLLTSQGVN